MNRREAFALPLVALLPTDHVLPLTMTADVQASGIKVAFWSGLTLISEQTISLSRAARDPGFNKDSDREEITHATDEQRSRHPPP